MSVPREGLIVPASMPLAVALRVAGPRQLPLLVTASASPKPADPAILITLEQLEAAAAGSPGALLGSLSGPTVYLIATLGKQATFSETPPQAVVDDSRGITPEIAIPKDLNLNIPPAAEEQRVVNVAVYYADDPPDLVAAEMSLAQDGAYTLRVNIGARLAESRLPADSPAINTPEIDERGLDLFVSVVTRGEALQFAAPTQLLHLPKHGDSAPVDFSFVARQPAADLPLWVLIYHNWTLLQPIELHLAVTAAEQNLPAPMPASVVYTRTAGFADLERLRPNEVVLLSLIHI